MVQFKKTKTKRAKKATAVARSLTANQKLEVKKLVKGSAETKMVAYYSGDGTRGGWAWAPHDGLIISNTTDIMRLIPQVAPGTGDYQRIGERISPIGLKVHGNVKFDYVHVNGQQAPQNVFCVLYVLQHVSLKTYTSLKTTYNNASPPVAVGGNDFTQLLRTGEGDTCSFSSLAYQADLPVADEFYRLLAKKIVPLRISGIVQAPVGSQAGASLQSYNNNSAQLCARYSFDLSKKIPKVLKYDEDQTAGAGEDPTNSSIFMAIGYYFMDYEGPGAVTNISNEYVSILTYKDL